VLTRDTATLTAAVKAASAPMDRPSGPGLRTIKAPVKSDKDGSEPMQAELLLEDNAGGERCQQDRGKGHRREITEREQHHPCEPGQKRHEFNCRPQNIVAAKATRRQGQIHAPHEHQHGRKDQDIAEEGDLERMKVMSFADVADERSHDREARPRREQPERADRDGRQSGSVRNPRLGGGRARRTGFPLVHARSQEA
jgi:hypothetical protein